MGPWNLYDRSQIYNNVEKNNKEYIMSKTKNIIIH